MILLMMNEELTQSATSSLVATLLALLLRCYLPGFFIYKSLPQLQVFFKETYDCCCSPLSSSSPQGWTTHASSPLAFLTKDLRYWDGSGWMSKPTSVFGHSPRNTDLFFSKRYPNNMGFPKPCCCCVFMPQCLLNRPGEMGRWEGAGKGKGILFIVHFITTAVLKLSTQALKASRPSRHNRKCPSWSTQWFKPILEALTAPGAQDLLADFCAPQPNAVRGALTRPELPRTCHPAMVALWAMDLV